MTIFFNEEAEMSLLGTVIINNAYFKRIADILEPKHFYYTAHQEIYKRFIEVAKQMNVNQVTLKEFFDSNEHVKEVGGSLYLSTLLSCASSIIDIRDYAKVMIELWQKRGLEDLLSESLQALSENKFSYSVAKIENDIRGLEVHSDRRKTNHISIIVDEIKNKRDLKIESKIISTGFDLLDEKLQGGFYSKQLAIIGARTAVGKTTMLQDIILSVSRKGKKCLFISLEVDSERVVLKFLSNVAGVAGWKIKRNMMAPMEYQNVLAAEEIVKKMTIFIDDSGDLKTSDIERVIRNQIEKQPVDLIAVDYIQHIKYENDRNINATMEISKNVIALKAMAQKFDVAMIAAAQINRAGVDKPTLAHFEGSSAIEKNADVAIIIHREELKEEERGDSYYSNSGLWIVAKNRDGKTGEIQFKLEGEFGRFREISTNN
jgi:replicative DNA helicase